ncbi:MAG: nuclear transport factor 2 family protein [Phycisphaerales bacterium]
MQADATLTETLTVGKKLADLCNQGKNIDAINALYDKDIVSVEAMCGSEDMPQTMKGKDAILGKNQWWLENHEVHSGKVTGPFPHGDRFILIMNYDVTPKIGPKAGQRLHIEEAGLYTVKNGKVTKEEFFYDMGGE